MVRRALWWGGGRAGGKNGIGKTFRSGQLVIRSAEKWQVVVVVEEEEEEEEKERTQVSISQRASTYLLRNFGLDPEKKGNH